MRVHDAASGCALCGWCQTFELGSCLCLFYIAVSSPRATCCDNSARGCIGGIADVGKALVLNTTPGSPAFHLGQQVGALVLERDLLRIAARDAKRAARPEQFRRGCPTGVRSWGTRCTCFHQAALGATEPTAPEDGGSSSPREDAVLWRVLECLGPGAGGLLAAKSLASTHSARATLRLPLPGTD